MIIERQIVTLVLTGLIYPFVMTGLAQVLFPWRANGSLVMDEKGEVVGSELIAQGFANPAYLQPRPSAAGEKGYDATSSVGFQPRSDIEKTPGPYSGDLKTAQRTESGSHRTCSRGTRHYFCKRTRPTPFASRCAMASTASCQSARHHCGASKGRSGCLTWNAEPLAS